MKPHDTLAKILTEHKVKVAYRDFKGSHMDLWLDYSKLTKPKVGSDLSIWGESQKVFDNIATTVRRFYPNAELSSQVPNRSVVYRVGYNQKPQ